MSDTQCDCYSCEGGDPSPCVACPVHGAWCDWLGEGPKCTPCGDADPLIAGGRCVRPVGHDGFHRNRTGFFWASAHRNPPFYEMCPGALPATVPWEPGDTADLRADLEARVSVKTSDL